MLKICIDIEHMDKPVPVQLLSKIIKSGAKANLEKVQLKRKEGK